MAVRVLDREYRVTQLGGTPERPLLRLEGVFTREHATRVGGELVLVAMPEGSFAEGEWLAEDLVGCRVEGLGGVVRVVGGPSCDVLELDDGTLVPLVSDAVTSVNPEEGVIEVDRRFLGLGEP